MYNDFYAAYWQQKPGDLEGFERQYLFQDLRLHRAMSILVSELKKTTPSLNPFLTGDWFRIDPAAHNVATEVEAVVVGLKQSISKLRQTAQQTDAVYALLPPSRRVFFNDNLRVQTHFLLSATETVYYLAEAVLAQFRQLSESRAAYIRQAARAAENMEHILSEAEHGRFEGWYAPLRSKEISSVFLVRERREAIDELLVGL